MALATLELHQTAFRVVLTGELGQALAIQPAAEVGQRLSHQQRLLVPVFSKKFFYRNAAKQLLQGIIRLRERRVGLDLAGAVEFGRGFIHIMLSDNC